MLRMSPIVCLLGPRPTPLTFTRTGETMAMIKAKPKAAIDEVEFCVIGSIADPDRSGDVGDLDLVVPILDGGESDNYVDLGVYEKLAQVTRKPIDLFMTQWPDQFNVAGCYDPAEGPSRHGRWPVYSLFAHLFPAVVCRP